MTFISWIMGLSLLIFLLFKGIEFHRAMVCRQEAWQKSMDLLSSSLFQGSPKQEIAFHATCRLSFIRNKDRVLWQKVPSLKKNVFELGIKGTL